VLGDFSGPLGLQADGFAIAPFQVKAEHRDVRLFDIAFNAPVATYEALLEGDGDDFQVPLARRRRASDTAPRVPGHGLHQRVEGHLPR